MNIHLTAILLSIVAMCVLSQQTMAVEMRGEPEFSGESAHIHAQEYDDSNRHALRGDFLSLSGDNTLTTSVGTFKIPPTASVEDHRTKKISNPQVDITFFGDSIRKVVIY